MQCVILAGGRGMRMQQLTTQVPKALIPVAGTPFIDYQLSHLAQTGVTEVVLCIGYKGEQIRQYVRDGRRWRLNVHYVDEGEQLRGTAGALRLALESNALNTRFLVTYGDAFLPIDFSQVWRYFQDRTEPALMTVYKNMDRWNPSNACWDGQKVTLYDKKQTKGKPPEMQFIDYGLCALQRGLVESDIPSTPFDLSDLFHTLSLAGQLAGMEVKTRFFEIGSPQGLEEFAAYIHTQPDMQGRI